MILKRDWLMPPIDWEDPARQPGLSREDMAVLLARGTPRRFRSLLSNIVRLPPGYALRRSSEGEPFPVRTWSALRVGSKYLEITLEERASELRRLLMSSVRRHSAGKRVGLLLSGGFDSTLLATLMARDGVDLRCYSIEAPEFYPSEWDYAFGTADRLRVPIRKLTVTLPDLLKSATTMHSFKRTPNMCLTTTHLLAASLAASEDRCDIVMSGTGSDELFGPGPRALEAAWRFEQRAKSVGQTAAWSMLLGEKSTARTDLLYKGNISPFPEEDVRMLFPDLDFPGLLEEDIVELYRELHADFPAAEYEKLMLQLELELRSSDVLMHELAAASHVYGMPIAFPFYDQAVVELAAGTPLNLKAYQERQNTSFVKNPRDASGVIHKYILRNAFSNLILVSDSKTPRLTSTLPFSWSTRGAEKQLVLQRIEGSSVWERLGVSRRALAKLIGKQPGEKTFWTIPLRMWLLYQISMLQDGK